MSTIRDLKKRYAKLKIKLLSKGLTKDILDAHPTLMAASKHLEYLDESGDLFIKTTMYCVDNQIPLSSDGKTIEAFDQVLKSSLVIKIHEQYLKK